MAARVLEEPQASLVFFLEFVTHSLLHLVDDYSRFGPLDSVSCFPFKNFLGNLKKLARKPSNPIAQILRWMEEKNACNTMNSSLLENKQ